MNHDPMPIIPPFPKGLDLHGQRRWVSEHGFEIELWRIRQALACGSEWMTWISMGLDDVCEHCRSAHQVPVPIKQMDVLAHYSACTCPDGCGCICGVCADPNEPVRTEAEVEESLRRMGIPITIENS